jgi:RHS repeat-associated protein
VINENGPDGNIDYQYGRSRISGSSSTLEQFYQTDGIGSTVDVTDATGSLKASYTYDPWGKILNPIDPLGTKDKFKFTGEALDPQTGLVFMHARIYDPLVGQFISKDPFPGLAQAPLTTNRYAYALSNPVNLVDPSGRAAEPASSDILTYALAPWSRFSGGSSGGGGASFNFMEDWSTIINVGEGSIIPYSDMGAADLAGEADSGLGLAAAAVAGTTAAISALSSVAEAASLSFAAAFPYATAATLATVNFFYGWNSPPSTSWDVQGIGSFMSAVDARFIPIDVGPLSRFPDTTGDFTVGISYGTVSGADPY